MLKLQDVHLYLGKRFSLIVDDLEVEESVLLLKGSNGSGKSTFLHLLLGLLKPKQGTILLDGKVVPAGRCHVNYALSSLFLPQVWTLQKALKYELKNRPEDDMEEIRKNLYKAFRAELFENKRFDEMSAGMMQKANLLLSLCGQPRFLLLDEPEAHLDEESVQAMFTAFEHALSKGVRIICATHTAHYWAKLLEMYPSKILEFPLSRV